MNRWHALSGISIRLVIAMGIASCATALFAAPPSDDEIVRKFLDASENALI